MARIQFYEKSLLKNYCENQIDSAEAATGGVLWKKEFLKFTQIWQENTSVGVSF